MLIPTMIDPTMAPPGKHFMSVFVQYVPAEDPTAATGPTPTATASATPCSTRSRATAPDFRELILHVEVRTPRELEAEVGLTEGNIFQGELTCDQLLFNRPVPGYAQYRGADRRASTCAAPAPIRAAASWRAPGRNAAREILRDLRKPNLVPEGWQDD